MNAIQTFEGRKLLVLTTGRDRERQMREFILNTGCHIPL
jgi:hypothetical protein